MGRIRLSWIKPSAGERPILNLRLHRSCHEPSTTPCRRIPRPRARAGITVLAAMALEGADAAARRRDGHAGRLQPVCRGAGRGPGRPGPRRSAADARGRLDGLHRGRPAAMGGAGPAGASNRRPAQRRTAPRARRRATCSSNRSWASRCCCARGWRHRTSTIPTSSWPERPIHPRKMAHAGAGRGLAGASAVIAPSLPPPRRAARHPGSMRRGARRCHPG
jgi:hypothetical protein